jgi:hypothetical protein
VLADACSVLWLMGWSESGAVLMKKRAQQARPPKRAIQRNKRTQTQTNKQTNKRAKKRTNERAREETERELGFLHADMRSTRVERLCVCSRWNHLFVCRWGWQAGVDAERVMVSDFFALEHHVLIKSATDLFLDNECARRIGHVGHWPASASLGR